MGEILAALAEIAGDLPVVLPLHPRTRKLIYDYGLGHHLASITVLDPLSFLDMVALEQAAKIILTDSGGVQKEAFFYGVPCLTMRDETEWVETVELGCNQLVGASRTAIRAAVGAMTQKTVTHTVAPYGLGDSASKIVARLAGN